MTPTRSRADQPRVTLRRVRPGDSLWSIAEETVVARGEPASAPRVGQEWRRWYRANRAAIGDDPDVLRVGLRLRTPTSSAAPSRHTVHRTAPSAPEGDHR